MRLVADETWEGLGGTRRELDFEVEVDGDLARPRIELDKHSEYRWIGLDEAALLLEQRELDDGFIHRVVTSVLLRRHVGR